MGIPEKPAAGFPKFFGSLASVRMPVVFSIPHRVGIVARLAVAFAAVTLLAVAANVIMEHGVVAPETAKVETGIPAIALPSPAPITDTTDLKPRGPGAEAVAAAILAASDQYDRAVRHRADNEAPEIDSQFQKAQAALDRALANLDVESRHDLKNSPIRAKKYVNDYKAQGESLVRLADDRRRQLENYSAVLESMNARMKNSFDRAWKIFGRIIARQFLVDLNSDLGELRHGFIAISSSSGLDDSAIEALAAAEIAFAANLQKNEHSLARSEGKDWLQQMQNDFSQLMFLRNNLLQLNRESRETAQNLVQAESRLEALIQAKVLSEKQAQQAKQTQPAATKSLAPPLPAIPQPSAQAVPNNRRREEQSTLIAWLSAGVLLLLVFICIGTVVSIVGPVKRMLKATALLAGGDTSVRVPRGGIKELDTLAVAFNRMAEQLSLAQESTRNYQQQLEIKVDERTRQLQYLAEHDPLTLLPNRRQLFALLNTAIEQAAASGRYVGVFFLDLDNFKNINDGMGHAFGDGVLQGIAQRLREAANAFGFAARLGGDEFTVIYESARSDEEIRQAGMELVRAFQKPLAIHGRELIVSVSVGASFYPEHEKSAEALLRAADAALFRAKALGRSQLTMFTPELLEAATAKFTTEQSLRRAIERNEFELVFQPEISLRNLETTVVEALLRWRLPDGRCASPADFLAVAEESGLIMEISDWVLRTAIAAAAHWYHGAWPQACVAINVSSRQLLHGGFVERVGALLREFKLPPRCIEIELTESVLQTGPATIEALRSLHAQGIAIALDDFGTGYSSLSSLQLLPLSRIKLDRSLIASIDTSPRSAAIARAIISLCESLGLAVTAEGVERPEQLVLLSQDRFICLQGYLLSRPVSGDSLLSTITNISRHMQSLTATETTDAKWKPSAKSKVQRLFR